MGLDIFSCFKGKNLPRRKRTHRRGRRKHAPQGLSVHIGHGPAEQLSPSAYGSPHSVISEEDYFDALEEHHHSPTSPHGSRGSSLDFGSANGRYVNGDVDQYSDSEEQEDSIIHRLSTWWSTVFSSERQQGDQPAATTSSHHDANHQQAAPPSKKIVTHSPTGSIPPDGIIIAPDDSTAQQGCIGIFGAASSVVASKRFLRLRKPVAGASFKRLNDDEILQGDGVKRTVTSDACAWEPADSTTFQVRSHGYMRTKIKESSAQAIYRLIGVDMYSFDFKLFHIAQHVELPTAPTLSAAAQVLPKNQRLPPLLIINMQLPLYAPTIFGTNDGPGHSLVYYFALPEGWDPADVPNTAALGMAQRFVNNGIEFDGQPTRDRLKLLPRIVNLEEWVQNESLSFAETRLIRNYNGKPLLTRPQHRYYSDPRGTYLEIDLDVHSYAYIARRGYYSYIGKLASVVFENGFVLQGNRPEELPEVVLAAARVHRVDFTKSRPFPAKSLEEIGHGEHPDGAPVRLEDP